jgi:hypothetical protein
MYVCCCKHTFIVPTFLVDCYIKIGVMYYEVLFANTAVLLMRLLCLFGVTFTDNCHIG